MYCNPITPQICRDADAEVRKFDDAHAKNPNFAGGDSRFVGFVGEKIYLIDFPSSSLARLRRYDFDMSACCSGTIYQLAQRLINVKSNGYHCPFKPLRNYRVMVASKELPTGNIVSEIDFVFVQVDLQRLKAYTVGWLPLTEFLRCAVRVVPPQCKFPAHTMLIADLNPIETLSAPRVLSY